MTQKIDTSSDLPRYLQVYQSLLQRIRSGEFDAALPAERQLARDYGVSRITVIKAMDRLQNDGVIDRQHGRGTFIRDATTPLDDPVHPHHLVCRNGFDRPAFLWEIAGADYEAAPEIVLQRVSPTPATEHFQITLLVRYGTRTVGCHHVGIRRDIAERDYLDACSAVELMRYLRDFREHYTLAQRALEAACSDSSTARWLDAPAGTPVLVIDKLYTDNAGNIAQFARSQLLSECFRYIL